MAHAQRLGDEPVAIDGMLLVRIGRRDEIGIEEMGAFAGRAQADPPRGPVAATISPERRSPRKSMTRSKRRLRSCLSTSSEAFSTCLTPRFALWRSTAIVSSSIGWPARSGS